MSSMTSAMLTWATPVRPDKLGESLEAYAKAAQTLHMLRLCHRFGQGPDVHVTKIPAEIELAIEALVIAAAKRQASCPWDNWSSSFSHFEGNCAPMDHIPDCYSPLSDALDGGVPLCETCEESYVDTETCEKACKTGDPELCWTCTQKVDHSNCMDTCDAEMTPEMNGLAMGWGYDDMDDCGEWRKRIDTKGNFAKYAKVSRRHFGIDVRFLETRIAREDSPSWPRRINHRYHNREELKTTLCYLVLAPHLVPAKTFESSDIALECGGASHATAQAVTVDKEATSSPPQLYTSLYDAGGTVELPRKGYF